MLLVFSLAILLLSVQSQRVRDSSSSSSAVASSSSSAVNNTTSASSSSAAPAVVTYPTFTLTIGSDCEDYIKDEYDPCEAMDPEWCCYYTSS